MNKQFFNEKGLTLVELLATIVIMSIIMFLLFNILLPMQKQYGEQSDKIEHLTDVTIAAKVITKDFRSANSVNIVEEDYIIIDTAKGENSYQLVGNILQKNEVNFIYDINKFIVTDEEDSSSFYLTIEGENGKKIETNIVLRGDG